MKKITKVNISIIAISLLALAMPALADKFSSSPLAAASPEGQYVVKTVVKQDGVNHFAHVYKLNEDMDR